MSASGAVPSLREIFDEYSKYIWRSLRHFGVAEADVEDVCQEVFITVHRKLPEFEGRSSLKTWLYGICLRTASDYRRRAYNRRERVMADADQLAEQAAPRNTDAPAESRQLVLSMLNLLDDEKREVLVLYEIEGFTMKEVAEIVRCPLQTAYSRLYAARARLASDVGEQEAKG
jgi:RNA polymerase sigma-70 factor (ECF subfamily)